MDFTESQLKAIHHLYGPAIVIAGPGAGKTRVITERVKMLITGHAVSPQSILVTTFTEKAANELKVRLAKTLGHNAKHVHISTIHSFCKSMLEDYFRYHNYGADINVIDDVTQTLILELNKQSFGYAHWSKSQGKVVNVKKGPGFLSGVKTLYDRMTSNNISSATLIGSLEKKGLLTDEDKLVIEGYDHYMSYLEAAKRMDFAMLQNRFYDLIVQHPEIAEELNQRFQFLLVDEYQDTSPIQDRIFELIAKQQQNLFVVGDEKQSIYSFRGASVENFRRFVEKHPGAKEYLLNVNFRSTQHIVDTSNHIFKEELRKELESRRKEGNKIKLVYETDSDATAKKTVALLKELFEQGVIKSYGDVAFLFRSLKSHSEEFIKYLVKERIPYITFGDGKFLEREEVENMLLSISYVTHELYHDPKLSHWGNWWRGDIFLSEMFAFSKETDQLIHKGNFKLYELHSEEDYRNAGFTNEHDIAVLMALNALKTEVEAHHKDSAIDDENKYSLLAIFYRLLDISGYFSRLLNEGTSDSREKLFNLGQLSRVIGRYVATRGKEDIKGFLWYVYNNADHFDQHKIEDNNTVKLMTIHKAKGMEFPVVVLCCLNEGRLPLRFAKNEFVHVPEELLWKEYQEDQEAAFFDEEKRLFYVGISRAQDILVLTASEKHKIQHWKKSRFLELIPGDLFCDDLIHTTESRYTVSKETPVLSYSAINSFIQCPLRYDLTYNYGFEFPRILTQSLGLFIHTALQHIHENMRNSLEMSDDDISDLVDRNWIDLPLTKSRNENFRKSFRERFREYYQRSKELFSEIVAIEESFSYIDDNMIIRGKVDLIAKDNNDNTLLIDFKTRSLEGLAETNVNRQLQIYDHCLETNFEIDKLVAYAFLDNERTEFPKDKKETETFLQEVSGQMQNEHFDKRVSELCEECQFNFHCTKH